MGDANKVVAVELSTSELTLLVKALGDYKEKQIDRYEGLSGGEVGGLAARLYSKAEAARHLAAKFEEHLDS